MLVTKKSVITGKMNSMEIDIKPEEWKRAQRDDEYLIEISSRFTTDEIEFLSTGITPQERIKIDLPTPRDHEEPDDEEDTEEGGAEWDLDLNED